MRGTGEFPNPDKPGLNIDDLRLKICGIALRGVGATTPTSRRLRSVFFIKIDSTPLRAVGRARLCQAP
jgi:hypothetical protein